MKKHKSAGAVIFREENNKRKYLLVCYGTKEDFFWDFPRGHIESGEKETEAAKREILEETGIKDLEFISGFRELYQYFFKDGEELAFKRNIMFLSQTKEKNVKLSLEHHDYSWLSYEKTLKRLTYDNSKEILAKAHSFLNSNLKRQKAK